MRPYIVHLGVSGFPLGNAVMQRVKMTFRLVKSLGYYPLIISKKSLHTKNRSTSRLKRHEGLPCVETSYYLLRPKSVIKRNLNKISGFFGELALLIRLRKKIHTALVYTPSFFELVYYYFLSKIFRFKVIIVYVELRSSIPGRQSGFNKINDRLFDKWCHKFSDGAIVISEYLKNKMLAVEKKYPVFKLPAITDYGEFNGVQPAQTEAGYVMYCGTIQYIEIILFIVELFGQLKNKLNYKGDLVLVVSGQYQDKWEALRAFIKKEQLEDVVKIYSSIPYEQLVSLYLGAEALLIPLRDTLQDIARFPHKISEYTAASKAIVSTNVGELKHYFKDGESAILADSYTIDAYVKALQNINDKQLLIDIGVAGNKIGYSEFHYTAKQKELGEFLKKLN